MIASESKNQAPIISGTPSVRVNLKGADRIASGHPWIFVSDVLDRGKAQAGDVVRVIDPRGRALGIAHYSSTSQICLRLLSPRIEEAGAPFFLRRFRAALQYRERVVRDTNAYRLIHGEADLLPGLVVDRYGDSFVVQTLSQGMDRAKAVVSATLQELFANPKPRAIIARNDVSVRTHESLPLVTEILAGEPQPRVPIRMNGLQLFADLLEGQKTGVFLDQRENYIAAARYARGRALDCFTSTGGFALHFASKCDTVEAIDSSAPTLAVARANREANAIRNVEFREADVFEFLSGRSSARHHYQTIVLDPPAFAKSKQNIENAARGYKEINVRALRLLDSGGILITCSCSHHMAEGHLLEIVAEAALDAGKTLRILERRTQAQDHPILLTVPETHYLKCLILEVV